MIIYTTIGHRRCSVRDSTVKFGEDAGKIWQTLYEHGYLDEGKLLEITKLTDREFRSIRIG